MEHDDATEDEARSRLEALAGLGEDDSLRAGLVAKGLNALAQLLAGNDWLGDISGQDLGALTRILANDAERVAERQLLGAPNRAFARAR